MRGDGRTSFPLVDGVRDLHFTYYADPDPSSAPTLGAADRHMRVCRWALPRAVARAVGRRIAQRAIRIGTDRRSVLRYRAESFRRGLVAHSPGPCRSASGSVPGLGPVNPLYSSCRSMSPRTTSTSLGSGAYAVGSVTRVWRGQGGVALITSLVDRSSHRNRSRAHDVGHRGDVARRGRRTSQVLSSAADAGSGPSRGGPHAVSRLDDDAGGGDEWCWHRCSTMGDGPDARRSKRCRLVSETRRVQAESDSLYGVRPRTLIARHGGCSRGERSPTWCPVAWLTRQSISRHGSPTIQPMATRIRVRTEWPRPCPRDGVRIGGARAIRGSDRRPCRADRVRRPAVGHTDCFVEGATLTSEAVRCPSCQVLVHARHSRCPKCRAHLNRQVHEALGVALLEVRRARRRARRSRGWWAGSGSRGRNLSWMASRVRIR